MLERDKSQTRHRALQYDINGFGLKKSLGPYDHNL